MTSHLVIQSFKKVTEMQQVIQIVDAQLPEVVQ